MMAVMTIGRKCAAAASANLRPASSPKKFSEGAITKRAYSSPPISVATEERCSQRIRAKNTELSGIMQSIHMIHVILPVGMLQCNCSIFGDEITREAIVVD